jgi:hypothetical protein
MDKENLSLTISADSPNHSHALNSSTVLPLNSFPLDRIETSSDNRYEEPERVSFCMAVWEFLKGEREELEESG